MTLIFYISYRYIFLPPVRWLTGNRNNSMISNDDRKAIHCLLPRQRNRMAVMVDWRSNLENRKRRVVVHLKSHPTGDYAVAVSGNSKTIFFFHRNHLLH